MDLAPVERVEGFLPGWKATSLGVGGADEGIVKWSDTSCSFGGAALVVAHGTPANGVT